MPRGLYLHIPFCKVKCHYCNFVITTQRSDGNRKRFFQALEKETAWALEKFGPLEFDTVYFGGGTPSALLPEEIQDLWKFLARSFRFKSGFEFTCEVNPGDVDQAKLETYREMGINRISLGAQAFQDHLLKSMNRPHGAREIFETLERLKALGFNNISLDLIVRLPGQTQEDLEASLREVVRAQAGQTVLYDLEVHEKTVYGHAQRQGKLPLPPEEEHLAFSRFAHGFLEHAGYVPYELATFAHPGFESRHNLIYWHNQEYLGLGPGAFSYLNQHRFQMAADVPRYFKKAEQGDWQPDTDDWISPEKQEMESLMTGLRLQEGIDPNHYPILRPKLEKQFEMLRQRGLFQEESGRLSVTLEGKFIFEALLKFLTDECFRSQP